MSYDKRNQVYIEGELVSCVVGTHEVFGEKFYEFFVKIPRLSGNSDTIPVTVSKRLASADEIMPGKVICAEGQLRTHNKLEEGKSKLLISVFVQNLFTERQDRNPNQVRLSGYICKEPVYRETPQGREVADILIAVNRAYNKSDYIPCIAGGRNARFAGRLTVGDSIAIEGRVQSRSYQKKYDDGRIEDKIAYEVSISKLATIETDRQGISDIEEYFLKSEVDE